MRYLPHTIAFVLLLGCFESCTLFKKNIPKPVTVSYNEAEFIVTLNSTAWNTKYLNMVNADEILNGFISNFKSEGSGTKNITLVPYGTPSDFILKFKSLSVNESSRTEKINDAKSPYNGQEVVLNSVECSAVFELVNTKKNTSAFFNCSNTKLRSEKVTNNRDLGDLIAGTNKDHTQYHTKLLSDKICLHLAQDVGRRIWVPITRRIVKNM